jgi:3-methyladenine DNA glycosylase AlkD
MQAYMKSAMPFRGISSPALKSLLSPLLAAHPLPDLDTWTDTVRELWDAAAYREERYAALAIARHRSHLPHQVPEALDRDLLVHAVDANLDGSTRTTPALSPYGREFFIRKAIGWALRDHARTDPDWVRAFVAERTDSLSGLSQREALRVIDGRAESRPQP